MSVQGFIMSLMHGARGKEAAKALILPDFFGTTGAATAPTVEMTASGSSPLSFDQAVAKPMLHLVTNIKPVQDFHGYDHPWPAGGGKNILPIDSVYHDNGTGDVTIFNGNITGTFTLSADISGVTSSVSPNAALCYIVVDGVKQYDLSFGALSHTYSGTITSIVVFSSSSYTQYRGTVKFQLEAGNTATSWTPYSNICPISGWKTITAWDDAKYGGNIEWNQEVYALQSNSTVYGITRQQVVDGDTRGIRYSGTCESSTTYTAVPVNNNFTEGHKYLYDIGCDLPSGCRLNFSSEDRGRAQIITVASSNKSFGVFIISGTTVDFTAYPMAFDLTQMFGAGNEPTTVAAVRALFPNDYYPYNAGEHTCVGAVNGEPYRKVPVTFGALSANKWDEECEIGAIKTGTGENNTVPDQIRTANYVPINAGATYRMVTHGTQGQGVWAFFYDENKNPIAQPLPTTALPRAEIAVQLNNGTEFTIPDGYKYIRWYFQRYYGTVYQNDTALNYPSSVTTYNPYTDTIYYGTLDLVTGDGTLDGAKFSLINVANWNSDAQSSAGYIRFVYNISDKLAGYNLMCDYLPVKETIIPTSPTEEGICGYTENSSIYVAINASRLSGDLSTASGRSNAFKAYLVDNPIHIVYELADPIPFHIDGVSVTPLKGKNNVWTDCGDTLSVTYISRDVSNTVGHAKADEATAV